MIYYKLWIIWISLQSIYAESRKKDLREHSSSRDSVPHTSPENPGSIIGTELTEGQKEAILQLHNAFRSMVKPHASNMLKMLWDTDLEKIAKDFSSKCIVAHNPDRHRLAKNYDWVGENIAWGTGSCGDKDCGDVYEGVKRWFSESNSYNYLSGQCSGKCTLYTQMVWWESNKLGCGAKKCGDRTILVCNYAPGGNYVGQRPYKSGPACSECPSGMTCEDNLCIDKTEVVKPGSKKDCCDLNNDMLKAAQVAAFTTPSPTTYALHSTSNRPVITIASQTPTKALQQRLDIQSALPTHIYTLPAGWNELPVKLTQVDSGMTSAIWGMNATHFLFLVEDFVKLDPIPGLEMHHISAGQAGVWGVGLNGNVFFRKGVTSENPAGSFWEKIHGNLKQIDSGQTGIVWGVNRYDRIFCRIGITADKPGGTGWMRIEGNMKYVSCGEYGCWAVDNRGDIYFRSGITEAKPEGVQWKLIPGRLRMIESGPLGLSVGLELVTSHLIIRDGVSQEKPEGTSWVKTELRLAHVTIGESGIIGILPDGTLVIRQDLRMYITQTNTISPTHTVSPTRDFPLDSFTAAPEATLPVVKINPSASTIDELRNSALETTSEFSKQHENPLKTIQDYNDLSAPPLKPLTPEEPEKLHLTPEMASKILKLIEQKGNEFEVDHHRAAAGSLLRNDSVSVENALAASKGEKSADASPDILNMIKPTNAPAKSISENIAPAKSVEKISMPEKTVDSSNTKVDVVPNKEETQQHEGTLQVKQNSAESSPTKATSENATSTTTSKQSEKDNSEHSTNVAVKAESSQVQHSDAMVHSVESKAESSEPASHPKVEIQHHQVESSEPSKPEVSPKPSAPPTQKPEPTPKKVEPTHHVKSTHKPLTTHAPSTQAKSTVLARRHHPTHTTILTHKHTKPKTTVAVTEKVKPKHILHKERTATVRPIVDVTTHMHTNVPKKMTVISHIHSHHHSHPTYPTHPTDIAADVEYPKPVFLRPHGKRQPLHELHEPVYKPTPHSLASTKLSTKFNPLKTQTHRIWVHSLATVPPKPTPQVQQLEQVHEAVHVEPTEPPATMSYDRPRVKANKLLIKGVTGGRNMHQGPKKVTHITPAPLSWNLARSCCTIPDSVCPIPNDCVGYIECHGYRGSHKDCDRGKLFNPLTNICDYPRNVDCGDSSKVLQASQIAQQQAGQAVGPNVGAAEVIPSQHVKTVVKGSDAGQPRINPPRQDFDGVLREVWFGLGLSPLLTMLTNNPRFPTHPDEYIVLDKFEAPPNAGDGYGQRLSTYYKAPQTGEYIFYMSCDNECELWVSPDSEEIHSNLILELKHGHFTSFRQWHKYPEEQTSRPIYLQQDSFYFMESFMKEGTGGDDLSVGVKLPNGDYDLPISSNLHLIPGDSLDVASLTSRKPGQPVQASASPDPAKAFQQPLIQSVPPVVAAFRPDLMGPQPGQTAEQWLANNHNAPVLSQAQLRGVDTSRAPGSIPGAEMYLNYPPDDMESFEQTHLSLKRNSVKRNKIRKPNVTAVR